MGTDIKEHNPTSKMIGLSAGAEAKLDKHSK
jgi:hypothetical protein